MTAGAAEPNAIRSHIKLGDAPHALLREIPIAQLVESPWNPREHFNADALATLAESLKTQGQLDPIVVRPGNVPREKLGGERWEIGAGHRRYRAAKLAGLTSLLAVVRELDDVAFLELLVFENGNRNDLQPLEEAAGYKRLMEQAGYDVPRIAERDGRSIKYVYDRIKLLQLIPAAKKLLREGTISAGHAIILARLTPTDQKRALGDPDSVDDYRMNVRSGGVFRPEQVEGELELKGGDVGVRSVRELQQWVHDNVRFIESYVDPVLFPDTFETLAEAQQSADKVVHITHDHAVTDGARDPAMRTYGHRGWKRADGRERSKKCDRSVIGLVVAGDHQSEAFRVCVNKNRCKVHWPQEAATYARRQKEAKKQAKAATGAKTTGETSEATPAQQARADRDFKASIARDKAKANREAALARAVQAVIKQRAPEFAKQVLAIRKELRITPAMAAFLWQQGLEPVEDDIIGGWYSSKITKNGREILDQVAPLLPGKVWGKDYAARLTAIASMYWLDTATRDLDKAITKAAVALADAELKAAVTAKKPAAKPPSKKKGRAASESS